MNSIPLPGCAPVPLAFYLKALGILRVVAEQKEPAAKGCWKGDTFVLKTTLDQQALTVFFLREYRPTPILVPWSGGDFFGVNRKIKADDVKEAFDKRPTSSAVIEAVLATTTPRLEPYRSSLHRALQAMEASGVRTKKDIEGSGAAQKRKKAELLYVLRNVLPDQVVPWIDSAAIIEDDGFLPNNLLGSGGGSDGNSHFSDNFMQSLWAVLPDFDCQRKKPVMAPGGTIFDAQAALAESLFDKRANNTQLPKLSPVLFDSTRVGGPNSASGFESDAASNPWDFVFMIEGACLFAGALAKKLGAANPGAAHFPFLLPASPVGAGSLGQVEASGKELWLPLWSSPAGLKELSESFSAGRIESHKRMAACGMDAVQAIAQYGVDRGIEQFQRIGLFRGRIGGDNYFTSAELGRFPVSRNRNVDLLADFDPWLSSFRPKASGERAPASANRALRELEASIMALCKQSDPKLVQDVIAQLGRCEQAMARSLKWAINGFLKPVTALSPRWLEIAYDGTAEYRLAASLASVHGRYGDSTIPMRCQFEPVKTWVSDGRLGAGWDETASVNVAWHEGNVIQAMNSVMARRLVLAIKSGVRAWPDTGRRFARLADIAAFIEGRVNFMRFAELLWGLCLLDWAKVSPSPWPIADDEGSLPGATFGLLKLCFAGAAVRDVEVPVVAEIHQRAAAGNGATATQLAARRLRASGLPAAVERIHQQGESVRRAAAALLFPLSHTDLNALADAVLRPKTPTP